MHSPQVYSSLRTLVPVPMTPLTDLMGTMRLESVNRMPQGAAMGNNGNSFCCSETCHPQYPGLYRLVCFQFFSRIYSAKATSMQSAVFSAIILPNESAMYILTISSSCCNVCWNTSNSVPAVAAKRQTLPILLIDGRWFYQQRKRYFYFV